MFHWLKVDWLPFSYKYYIFYLVTLHYFIEASCKDTHENQKISVTWYATQIVLKITFQKLAFVAVKECNSDLISSYLQAAPFFFFFCAKSYCIILWVIYYHLNMEIYSPEMTNILGYEEKSNK